MLPCNLFHLWANPRYSISNHCQSGWGRTVGVPCVLVRVEVCARSIHGCLCLWLCVALSLHDTRGEFEFVLIKFVWFKLITLSRVYYYHNYHYFLVVPLSNFITTTITMTAGIATTTLPTMTTATATITTIITTTAVTATIIGPLPLLSHHYLCLLVCLDGCKLTGGSCLELVDWVRSLPVGRFSPSLFLHC